ncbi:MAG: putative HtrA2 peptidase, partial [Candidatus Saccharibacteria bacterium]|nr:putative HtrA2 peptidase [Candidatus Saccharibacteria bacterium]
MTDQPEIDTNVPKEPTSTKRVAGLSVPNKALVRVAAFIILTVSLGFLGGWLGANSRDHQSSASKDRVAQQQVISNESELISSLATEVGPSVVSVNVTSQAQATDFFGFSRQQQEQSAGTGFILSKDGYIITNRHVVPAGVTNVSITLSDGTELTDVQVVGRTNESDPLDVAFLKVKDKKGKELTPAKIGDSSKMKVGDKVIAIGNALGQFQNSVTAGILSGFGRSVEAQDAN